MLLVFAAAVLGLVVFSWRMRLSAADYDWTEHPTGLGDTACYTAMIGGNDFLEPNLKFKGQEAGVFRRAFNPVVRDDARMRKAARDLGDRHFVYQDAKVIGAGKANAAAARLYYLKSAENRYIEFGPRKFYPENPEIVEPPKAQPVGKAGL